MTNKELSDKWQEGQRGAYFTLPELLRLRKLIDDSDRDDLQRTIDERRERLGSMAGGGPYGGLYGSVQLEGDR